MRRRTLIQALPGGFAFAAGTAGAIGAGLLLPARAEAAVAYYTEPRALGAPLYSQAVEPRAYRKDAARYVYESYPTRIWQGRLPPLIHGVVVVETTVDGGGRPQHVQVVRGPSHAPDVSAAIVQMIRRLSPLPIPSRMASGVRYTEIWLMHRNGQFQLDALTEGQD